MLVAWPLYAYIRPKKCQNMAKDRRLFIRSTLVIGAAIVVTFSWQRILRVLVGIGILKPKYLQYVSYADKVNITWRQTILFAVLLLLILYFKTIITDKYEDYNFLYVICSIGFIFTLLSINFSAMGRIGLYYFYAGMIDLNAISVNLNEKSRIIFNLFLIMFLLFSGICLPSQTAMATQCQYIRIIQSLSEFLTTERF